DGRGVGAGADRATLLSGECLDRRSGVHVRDGNDFADVHDRGKFAPAGLHLADVGHVGHGAAGIQVGKHNDLVRAAENVCAFRHEMNAAEHDVAGISFSSLKRELEGIAAKIGELDDLVALVVVTEDNDILAQTRFGSGDTVVQGVIRNEQVGVKVATHRSEEHTSELQSLAYLVCRLLLEKKKKKKTNKKGNENKLNTMIK